MFESLLYLKPKAYLLILFFVILVGLFSYALRKKLLG